ncbi:MAG: hypothetical protein LBG79_02180 [Spirochaetaceae bacterium]|jgi:hypothetical protein|nr:hypothetical protein [Spirochaetaceae bacterium]
MNKKFIAIAVLSFAFFACRQDVLLEHPDDNGFYSSSFRLDEIFDKFWQGMNCYYVYWDIESKGYWSYVYKEYRPKFEQLGLIVPEEENGVVIPNANVITAYKYFKDMTAPLHDGHLSIEFNPYWFSKSYPSDPVNDKFKINPNYNRVLSRAGISGSAVFLSDWSDIPLDKNCNFWQNIISQNFTNHGSYKTSQFRFALGTRTHSQGGTIVYIYFSQFSIRETLNSEGGSGQFTSLWEKFYEKLQLTDLRGVIIDVRGNGGGANADIPLILGPMLKNRILIAETRVKKSLAPLEYKPWAPYYLSPSSAGMVNRDLPVVLICNDFSISCAELLTMAVKQMNNGYVIGRKSFGALGPRVSDISPIKTLGGSFSGGPFWVNVIQAGLQTRGPDKRNYDGIGITPDKIVELNASDFYNNGTDPQLDAAIKQIDP